MPLITAAQLGRVAPHAAARIVAAIVDHADDVLPRYGLATVERLPDFLAHVLVESAYLRRVDEDLNYSAERLCQVWPTRFPTLTSAEPFARQPRALANRVYGGRMGNTDPDDGWLNRGQGLLQTTGHDNIARLAKHLGLAFDAARALLTSDAGMLEAAAATYCLLGAPAHADRGDIVGSTRAVNGGLNGLAERRAAFALCRKVWPRVTSPATPKPAPAPAPPATPSVARSPVKQTTFLALVLSLFGISAAQAGEIDLTPVAQAGIEFLVLPVLGVVLPYVAALLVLPLRRFLDQKTADILAGRVNDVLDKAISYGAKQAEAFVARSDFHAGVDGWIQTYAAKYATDHAPALMQKAGGVLAEKIDARLSAHADVLALKSSVPLQLAGAAS